MILKFILIESILLITFLLVIENFAHAAIHAVITSLIVSNLKKGE